MDREFILKLVRVTLETYTKTKKPIIVGEYPEELNEERGVFISLYKTTGGFKHLRGTVGSPFAEKPLIKALMDYAMESCRDPSFVRLTPEDIDNVQIEVSILGEPELMDVVSSKDYLKHIELGKHGLMLRKGIMTGVILPEVAKQRNWDHEQLLQHLCIKAGLNKNAWTNLSAKIYKFETETFSE